MDSGKTYEIIAMLLTGSFRLHNGKSFLKLWACDLNQDNNNQDDSLNSIVDQ